MGEPRIVSARGIMPRADSFVGRSGRAGLLLVDGLVKELLEGSSAIQRAKQAHGAGIQDLGDVVLVPGLVNAHAHLELSGLGGKVEPGSSFPEWVGGVLKHRFSRTDAQLAEDAAHGLKILWKTGTRFVGDISSSSATEQALAKCANAPNVVLYKEVIDAWDPGRTGEALESLESLGSSTAKFDFGYSPHAPYTVGRELLAGLARHNRRRPRPLAMHWAEMAEELEWMESGTGPFASLLGESPRRSGLDLLEEAGLLCPSMALIHGNLPASGEVERIARSGASLVHCPGTHRYFGREEFPLGRYQRAGVFIAIGTDSLASNVDLDLKRELILLAETHPELSPEQLFRMGTEAGARAIGKIGIAGCLTPGAAGSFLPIPLPPGPRGAIQTSVILEHFFQGLS